MVYSVSASFYHVYFICIFMKNWEKVNNQLLCLFRSLKQVFRQIAILFDYTVSNVLATCLAGAGLVQDSSPCSLHTALGGDREAGPKAASSSDRA